MKNEKKSNNSNTYFLSLFFHLKNLYFVRNHIWKNLVYTVAFLLHFFRVEGYWDCSNKKINTLIEWIGLVDIFFRPSIFGNRLGILTEVLVAMDNYLFFHFLEKHLQFRKTQNHLLKNFLVHPTQVTGSTYYRIVYQIMYISNICT